MTSLLVRPSGESNVAVFLFFCFAFWRRRCVHQVCCAWDLYITMYSSAAETANKITIPSVYVTMKGGEALKAAGEVDVEVRKGKGGKAAWSWLRVDQPILLVFTAVGGSVTAKGVSVAPYPCLIAVRADKADVLCSVVGQKGKD